MRDHNLRPVSTDLHFRAEVRLIRWGESSTAGRTITLELPPDDGDGHPFKGFPTGHAHGQRFWMAFDPIADDEQVASEVSCAASVFPDRTKSPAQPGCGPSAARDRYAVMSSGEKAVVRAAMLPNDERFRAWATVKLGGPDWHMVDPDAAAQFIRERCCGGSSRKLIAEDPEACDKFISLETAFKIAVGEIAEPR